MNVSALVLAAGISLRMSGSNKLLLPLGGKALVAHTVDHLLAAAVDEVLVVIGYQAEQVQTALSGRGVKFVFNADYAGGLSTSIVAGVRAVAATTQAFLISLGDVPLVTAAEIDLVLQAFVRRRACSIAVPVHGGRRGHPVVFDRVHESELLALSGDAGGKTILARHPHAVLEVAMPADHILCDVDTPAAYERLCRRWEESGRR
ncbi:MAG: nucleotidyltransferase family protein [candidate division KSB1 bacterium]|nr:nucleotidyltransferase family protein [candidate division KSB1 bacterium]MDZ7275077.1 nucleotidyltransferase family protein [candidate division KSB1 bacterium]MDZ7286475.1 nucleotidyltransferase family protein [candidate division KSB1 bacterium]MDZ7299361.1 nucleotidyltransferase family protein [candidate division KSB1 bacterium]MDZ7306310.1 nucleotidyltransferase family protein [candidate division KSB1 bacterium]